MTTGSWDSKFDDKKKFNNYIVDKMTYRNTSDYSIHNGFSEQEIKIYRNSTATGFASGKMTYIPLAQTSSTQPEITSKKPVSIVHKDVYKFIKPDQKPEMGKQYIITLSDGKEKQRVIFKEQTKIRDEFLAQIMNEKGELGPEFKVNYVKLINSFFKLAEEQLLIKNTVKNTPKNPVYCQGDWID